MANHRPQVCTVLECQAQLRYVLPANKRILVREPANLNLRDSDKSEGRLSGSDNVVDLHMAVRPISDLNNNSFFIDVLLNCMVVIDKQAGGGGSDT